MQVFPVDVWNIKEYGIEEWHKGFSWPVPIPEFERLRNEIEHLYLGIASESHPDVEDALWVLFSWTGGLARFLHALLVIQRIQDAGKTIRYSPFSQDYKILAEGEPIQRISGKPLPPLTSWRRKIGGQIRTWQENYNYHGFDIGLYLKPHHLTAELDSIEVRQVLGHYSISCGRRLDLIRSVLLMPHRLDRACELPGCKESVTCFIDGLEALALKFGLHLEKRHQERLRGLFVKGVKYVGAYIYEIRKNLSLFKRTSILVQTLGATFNRSLCAAGKKEGFQIVGFPHGNYMDTFKISTTSYVLKGLVDTYVVPSEGAAELSSMAVENFLHRYQKHVDIVCCRNSEYGRRSSLSRGKAISSSIEKVMIIESALTPIYQGWPYQLDLNLRIAKLLRGYKMKAILKKHPDRLREAEGVYDCFYDELLAEPFEETWDKADAYIIPHIGTTAFGVALFTNKPIIIFEYILEYVWEQASELIRKRCRVIPSRFSEDGSILFDEDKLIQALQDPPEEPNDEFIDRYML
tara:strand:+ start:3711 stop:5273 length:1563 start_codon:yes stop_codon:yes gene_type:complete